jgi:endonuclease/exonuclease/phosphatase family metal-dependent hydrolase
MKSVVAVAVMVLGWAAAARADRFEVLSYNAWLRPAIVFPGELSRARARLLPRELVGYDAVVLEEVFDEQARATVLRGLAVQGYRYTTRRLGPAQLFVKDGGVIIASRWPIVAEAQRLFPVCANTNLCLAGHCLVGDCNAHKGVVYAAIEKEGRRYHLFGTHAQAGEDHAAREVREGQLRVIRTFIDSRHIASGEPVIIAGDLNIDEIGSRDEYRRMLKVLGASAPQQRGGLPFSDDPVGNLWTRADKPDAPGKVIDHILIADDHLRPTRSRFEVRPVRIGGQDLSDHHAVYARLDYPTLPAANAPPARAPKAGP